MILIVYLYAAGIAVAVVLGLLAWKELRRCWRYATPTRREMIDHLKDTAYALYALIYDRIPRPRGRHYQQKDCWHG